MSLLEQKNVCPHCNNQLLRGAFYFVNGTPKCGKCAKELPFNPSRPYASLSQPFCPVLIFEDAAGNVRFPGSSSDPVPPGFARRELRTIAEVRKFEGRMNSSERRRWDEYQAREEVAYNAAQRERRAELRAQMQHMTPFGRDLAQHAMDENDRRPRGNYDPGFRVDVFSTDASNREAHRSERTGWQGRK